jgi:hypothetical protein
MTAVPDKHLSRGRKLIVASWIQFACAIPGSLILLLYLLQPEEIGRIPMWFSAPLSLAASFFLRRGRPWAWYLSLALTPMYPFAPYFDLIHIRGSLHGGEAILALGIVLGLVLAIVLLALLLLGRGELMTNQRE